MSDNANIAQLILNLCFNVAICDKVRNPILAHYHNVANCSEVDQSESIFGNGTQSSVVCKVNS